MRARARSARGWVGKDKRKGYLCNSSAEFRFSATEKGKCKLKSAHQRSIWNWGLAPQTFKSAPRHAYATDPGDSEGAQMRARLCRHDRICI